MWETRRHRFLLRLAVPLTAECLRQKKLRRSFWDPLRYGPFQNHVALRPATLHGWCSCRCPRVNLFREGTLLRDCHGKGIPSPGERDERGSARQYRDVKRREVLPLNRHSVSLLRAPRLAGFPTLLPTVAAAETNVPTRTTPGSSPAVLCLTAVEAQRWCLQPSALLPMPPTERSFRDKPLLRQLVASVRGLEFSAADRQGSKTTCF